MFFSRFYEVLILTNVIIVVYALLIIAFTKYKFNKTVKIQERIRYRLNLILKLILLFTLVINSIFIAYMINNLDSPIKDNNGIASVLEERLPDKQTQEDRHKDLLSAIKSVKSNSDYVDANNNINTKNLLFSILGGVCASLLGILLFYIVFKSHSTIGKKIKIFTYTLSTLFEISSLTFFTISSCDLYFDFKDESSIVINSGNEPKKIGIIQGFESAIDTVASFKQDSVFKSLFNDVDISKINSLILIGGVDKNPLKGTAKAVYGENLGLAMSRANWVKKKLLSYYKCDLDTSKIIVLGKGPNHIGLNISSGLKSKDRCVTVYVSQSKPNTNKINNKIDE